jgi:hypothetical protein
MEYGAGEYWSIEKRLLFSITPLLQYSYTPANWEKELT